MVMAWYMQRIDFVRRKGRGRHAEKSALEPVCLKSKTLCTLYLLNFHFCILFIWTLFIVQFNKITTFHRLALSPSSADKRERAKGR
jgi:hypothetical protein